jgi:hypothetical protein
MRFSRSLLALSILTAPLLASRPALADDDGPARTFGDKERFALAFDEGVTFNSTDVLTNGELLASYFVIPHLSIGVALGAQWLSDSPTSNANLNSSSIFVFHAGPRVGYDLAVADKVSVWPQVGVDYRMYDQTTNETNVTNAGAGFAAASQSVTSTSSAFGLTAMVPVLLHPVHGFFVGAGPVFYTEFSNSQSTSGQSVNLNKITSLGLVFTIGGAI